MSVLNRAEFRKHTIKITTIEEKIKHLKNHKLLEDASLCVYFISQNGFVIVC